MIVHEPCWVRAGRFDHRINFGKLTRLVNSPKKWLSLEPLDSLFRNSGSKVDSRGRSKRSYSVRMVVRSLNAGLFAAIIGCCICFSHAFLPAVPGRLNLVQHRSVSLERRRCPALSLGKSGAEAAACGVSSGRGMLRAVGPKMVMRDEPASPPSADGADLQCQELARGPRRAGQGVKPAVAEGRQRLSQGEDGGVNAGRRRALGFAGAAAALLISGQPAATLDQPAVLCTNPLNSPSLIWSRRVSSGLFSP